MAKKKSEAEDIIAAAKKEFAAAVDAETDNRQSAESDIRFARLGEQWPEKIRKLRETEGRPCLTINKMPAFIRQVVNDARQNKPSIKTHPVDNSGDKKTAEVIDGIIRNIEYSSNADVAYDTGIECAVTGGFGYWRVVLDYARDDAFDLDIMIKRVANPFSVYGDPNSREADSSDWDTAFVVDRITKKQYEARFGKDRDGGTVDWDSDAWSSLAGTDWVSEDEVMIAEWWRRVEVEREIVLAVDLRDGSTKVFGKEEIGTDPDLQTLIGANLMEFRQTRMTKSHEVTQHMLSGADMLQEPVKWPGRYIPVVPVYGDEFDVKGKRILRSLIHNATDAQRMVNYWRSTSTELVALAPRVPYIGPKGAFDTDQDKWNTANSRNHPYIEYDGMQPPMRQPLDSGTAAGAMQEALSASDDMKAIIGLHDASLGARSNETSGRAIMARQREGDVSTFHFIDNLSRAIRHTGRIIIDLIPKVMTKERIVRIIGEDGKEDTRKVNAPYQAQDPKTGQPMMDAQGNAIIAMHDLTTGKYDLTVKSGPSFTTRREEAVAAMTELIRAFPQSAQVVGPELAKNFDWPGADKIAEKMEQMASGQLPPEVQKMVEQGKAQIQKLTEENQKLKQDKSEKIAEIQADQQIQLMKLENEREIAQAKLEADQQIEFYKAQAQAGIAAQKAAQMANSRPAS